MPSGLPGRSYTIARLSDRVSREKVFHRSEFTEKATPALRLPAELGLDGFPQRIADSEQRKSLSSARPVNRDRLDRAAWRWLSKSERSEARHLPAETPSRQGIACRRLAARTVGQVDGNLQCRRRQLISAGPPAQTGSP
jgi:hypothetical protein